MSTQPGLTATEMIDAGGRGSIRALYIVGEDPAMTGPDSSHTRAALAATEFVSEEVKGNPGIYPPAETVANAFALTAHSPEFEEVLTRTWTRIKTGQ